MALIFELGVVVVVVWVPVCVAIGYVTGCCVAGLASAARRSDRISCVAFSSSVGIPM